MKTEQGHWGGNRTDSHRSSSDIKKVLSIKKCSQQHFWFTDITIRCKPAFAHPAVLTSRDPRPVFLFTHHVASAILLPRCQVNIFSLRATCRLRSNIKTFLVVLRIFLWKTWANWKLFDHKTHIFCYVQENLESWTTRGAWKRPSFRHRRGKMEYPRYVPVLWYCKCRCRKSKFFTKLDFFLVAGCKTFFHLFCIFFERARACWPLFLFMSPILYFYTKYKMLSYLIIGFFWERGESSYNRNLLLFVPLFEQWIILSGG